MPDLRGTKRCVNPKCNRQLYGDYVKLSSDATALHSFEPGQMLLCCGCWATKINDLPEAMHAVCAAEALWHGAPREPC